MRVALLKFPALAVRSAERIERWSASRSIFSSCVVRNSSLRVDLVFGLLYFRWIACRTVASESRGALRNLCQTEVFSDARCSAGYPRKISLKIATTWDGECRVYVGEGGEWF